MISSSSLAWNIFLHNLQVKTEYTKKKICPYCDKEFFPLSDYQVYDTKECGAEMRKKKQLEAYHRNKKTKRKSGS